MIMQKCVSMMIILGIAVCRNVGAQENPAPFTLEQALQNAVDAPKDSSSTGRTGTRSTSTPAPTVSPVYHDAQERIVVQGDNHGNYGMSYPGDLTDFCEVVDA